MFDEKFTTETVWIRVCILCGYWNCDHDWEKEPDGPLMPNHIKRFERFADPTPTTVL